MKHLVLAGALLASTSLHAATYSINDTLTPDSGDGLAACLGQSTCDLGFGELSLINSTILPAGFSQAGLAIAPDNGGAYVATGAGGDYGSPGYAAIVMDVPHVNSFSYAFSTLDSIESDGIGNVLWVYSTTGTYQIGGHEILPFLTPEHDGEFMISGIGDIERVQFVATQNAYEVNHFEVTRGVPEASTWVMMLMGFAGLGYAALDKRVRRAIV